MRAAVGEARQFTLEHNKRLRQDLSEEFKKERVGVRQQCEGRTEVVESKVDGCPCPLVVDTGAAKTVVKEEVVFMADMEEPCLLGLDFLVQSAALYGETVPLILEDAVEQVETPVTSSDVEDERLELHCSHEGRRHCDTRGRQAAASSCGGEVDGDAGDASSALPPHVVDLEVRSSTKLTPEQVVKLEKLLMEHEDVFSQDAQDFGCRSLVQHSINTADSPPIKQPHRRVLLAKREEMRLPLDLATRSLPGEELPQTAPELRMEATRRQVSRNLRLAGQAMTRWYQLRARDAQYAVGDRVWLYNPRKKRVLTLKLQSYWELRKASTPFCNDSRPSPTSWAMAQTACGLLRKKATSRGGQQRPPSSPDSEMESNNEVEGDGGIDNVVECAVGTREDPRGPYL
ncbi:hypothetical protein E2C01_051695 [Portunus trituberculatus]|uniref:Uncharacterized protein n=1 Tax=Portunus trituberculatus TaxID=210409 RepID=A0A5B7GL64_PORTR|nr:hypothetical protein [Portunus trituberculatus]